MARSATSKQSAGLVRIIGGDWRGRKLPVVAQTGLRPTSDRIRETLFNWLQFEVAGADCLDVFAGSGALGFEAKSRGAAQLVMLEKSAAACQQLKQNRTLLQAQAIDIVQTDSLQYLQQPAQRRFDLVFIDPPFGQGLVAPILERLFTNHWLNDQAWLYIEQEKTLDWPVFPAGWALYREKTSAQVRLGLWYKPAYHA